MKHCVLIAFVIFLFVGNGFAQIQELSFTAKDLKSKVEVGDYEAILTAARTKDLTLIPYLEQLADVTRRSHENSVALKLTLDSL